VLSRFKRFLIRWLKLSDELWIETTPTYPAWLKDKLVIDGYAMKDSGYWNKVIYATKSPEYMNELSEMQHDIERKISRYICDGETDKVLRWSERLKGVKSVMLITKNAQDQIYKLGKQDATPS